MLSGRAWGAMSRGLSKRIPFVHRGTVSTAVMNAWLGTVDDAHSRAERDRLALGRNPDGPGNGLRELGGEECWALLASQRFGRIGFSAHSGRPVILPVNYAVTDHQILIRTGRGPKLEAARRQDLVAFEVDEIDVEGQVGWSVTLTGRAHWVREPATLARLGAVDFAVWAAGPRSELIVIEPLHIGGRRLVTAGIEETATT
jgi:hypothetical protein